MFSFQKILRKIYNEIGVKADIILKLLLLLRSSKRQYSRKVLFIILCLLISLLYRADVKRPSC